MRTEYQISGSTPVTSRENGAVQEMVTELTLLEDFKLFIADIKPEEGSGRSTEGRTNLMSDQSVTVVFYYT